MIMGAGLTTEQFTVGNIFLILLDKPWSMCYISSWPAGPTLIEPFTVKCMPQIVDQLRSALEFASFRSPDIRDAVTSCIKELAKDMSHVEFEPDIRTIQVFKELGAVISEFENQFIVVVAPGADHEVDRDGPVDFIISEEIEHVISKPKIVSTDDDDIED